MRWQFKGEAPVSFKVVMVLFFANLIAQLGTAFAIPRWLPTTPDAVHSSPIRFRGGAVYFIRPWLEKYFEYGFWAHFVLLALLFLSMWLHRDEVERVS